MLLPTNLRFSDRTVLCEVFVRQALSHNPRLPWHSGPQRPRPSFLDRPCRSLTLKEGFVFASGLADFKRFDHKQRVFTSPDIRTESMSFKSRADVNEIILQLKCRSDARGISREGVQRPRRCTAKNGPNLNGGPEQMSCFCFDRPQIIILRGIPLSALKEYPASGLRRPAGTYD